MDRLTVTLKTVTPLFLGGADPNGKAELRASSIKGALRFWYRAIDPEYNKICDYPDSKPRTWEEKIFGSAEHGQGCFSMKFENGFMKGDNDWVPGNNQGLRYLSFSLSMGGNRRKCIPPNTDICITLTFRRNPDDKEKKAILASLWILGHVGGLGSRSRRGLGTVALQSWNCRWNECEELRIAHNAKSVDDWWYIFETGLGNLRKWFPAQTATDHSVFGGNTKFFLFKNGKKNWDEGLDAAGLVMQEFRDHWDVKDTQSDYHVVKAHLAVDPRVKMVPLNASPERAAFGLPLTFRYKELNEEGNPKRYDKNRIIYKNITFTGEKHDRSASPIHIRIVRIGECHYPLYIRLDSPLLDNSEQVKYKDKDGTAYIKPKNGRILDIFWNELKKNNDGLENTWK